MHVLDSLRRVLRETVRVDRTTVEPRYTLRCTIGVAIPLIIALATDHPLSGVSAALGAQVTGFAARQGVYRTRAATMLLTAAATAAGALVGALTGDAPAINVALSTLWGAGYGLIGALGNAANAVGLNSLIALVIFSQIGFTPEQAVPQALLVLAGGIFQTLLLVMLWPLGRFTAERRVLEGAYRTLADYAEHLPDDRLATPDPKTLVLVHDTLADPRPFARRGETSIFEALLVEAERLRGTMAALVTDRHALAALDPPDADAVAALCAHAHDILAEIADALHAARAPADVPAAWRAIDAAVTALEAATGGAGAEAGPLVRQTAGDARALAGQLRAAWRAGKAPAEPNPAPPSPSPSAQLFRVGVLTDGLATVRANCSLRSPYGRHALRVGLTIGIACTLEHVLPIPRGYWIPLTAALVLRPDFSGTFTRGFARLGGTLLGAAAATTLAFALHPAASAYLVLALVAVAIAYLTVAANYALFSVGITAYVVFLLAFGGLPEHTAVAERIGATFFGGLLALLAYALWPMWEHERVPEQLAQLVERARVYGLLVLRGYADAAQRDEHAIVAAQSEVRVARANAEASVDRTLAEPVRARGINVRAALGILAAGRRFSLAVLTLHSRLSRAGVVDDPALMRFINALDVSMRTLSVAMRSAVDAGPLPPLREIQAALEAAIRDNPGVDAGLLRSETELMVESVTMIAHLVHGAQAARRRIAARRARRARRRGQRKPALANAGQATGDK